MVLYQFFINSCPAKIDFCTWACTAKTDFWYWGLVLQGLIFGIGACIARTDFGYWGLYCKDWFCVLGPRLQGLIIGTGACIARTVVCGIGHMDVVYWGLVLGILTLCTRPCVGPTACVYWAWIWKGLDCACVHLLHWWLFVQGHSPRPNMIAALRPMGSTKAVSVARAPLCSVCCMWCLYCWYWFCVLGPMLAILCCL